MKKFLSLVLLVLPLVSVAMHKDGQGAGRSHAKKTGPTADSALKEEIAVARGSTTHSLPVVVQPDMSSVIQQEAQRAMLLAKEFEKEVKAYRSEEDECAIFADSLCDMRYHHLADPLLKRAFKASIEMTLTHGERLLDNKIDESQKVPLIQKLLMNAQSKLADIVTYSCTNVYFVANAESLFDKIGEKYKEVTAVTPGNEVKPKKTVVHDMEAYSTLGFMLEHYNELTGTSRKDMLKGTELVAVRLIAKATEAKALSLSTAPQTVAK